MRNYLDQVGFEHVFVGFYGLIIRWKPKKGRTASLPGALNCDSEEARA